MARQRQDEHDTPRQMGIGRRLLLLMAIPLSALLVMAGFGVHRGVTESVEASALSGRTDLALASYTLVGDLQAERAELVRSDTTTPELRAAVEASSQQLQRLAEQTGGRLRVQTEAALERVAPTRSIAERELGGAVALRVYSAAITELLDLSTIAIDPDGAVDDAASSATDYLARAQAASAEERDLVTVLLADDTLDAQSFQEVMSLASAQAAYLDLAAAGSPPALAIRIRQVGFASSAADAARRAVFAGSTTPAEAWIEGLDERTSQLTDLQRAAEAGAVAAVDQLARGSRLLFATAALSALAIVLVSALLLRRAIRSIARPLQQLAVQAEDVARTRLPEAVATQQAEDGDAVHLPVLRATGAAEVHEVAHAFNEVQETALRLAGEQAALRRNQGEALTNLGRRNQTLLARQLDFISSLETRETDPVFLEHLFKLDHLASRMRRNAESLLILAGSETPRRRRTPAPISEIVRAAMSEVEDFERVRIGNVREATIAGPAVIDLIHLLAELIENALGFSPPDSTVEIDGRSLGQGGYQFAVIDHGVGMTDVELLAANHRLGGADELEGMPTRYLGQYVVAKLAAKTGAMVRLQPSSGGRGVTALVILPTSALVGERDRAAVAQPLPGSRAAREQGPVPFAPGTAVAPALDAPLAPTTIETAPTVRTDESFEVESFEVESFEAQPFGSFGVGSFGSTPLDGTTGDESDPEGADEPAAESIDAAPALTDALPWLATPPEPDADPWRDFLADDPIGSSTPEPAVAEPAPDAPALHDPSTVDDDPASAVPPPAPAVAPAQPGWVPAAAGPSDTDHHAATTSTEDRTGGLTRRVPGASLAESRGRDVAGGASPGPTRSAADVRSMLASFQAGRHRGLDDGNPADASPAAGDPADELSSVDATASTSHPNSVHDGRSSQ